MKALEAVRICRSYGQQGDYANLLRASDSALQILQETKDDYVGSLGISKDQSVGFEACVIGYKGIALLKLNRHSEALPLLEKAQFLREQGESLRLKSRLKKLPDRSVGTTTAKNENNVWFLKRQEGKAIYQALMECYAVLRGQPPLPKLLKYPRTTHLFDSGGTAITADDLVLPNLGGVMDRFCRFDTKVLIEEKVDGANLGVSLCPLSGKIFVQNRSHYISKGDQPQFNRIPEWVETYREILVSKILKGGSRVLYGEWVTAKHSIPYHRLPDWFVAFDLYDKTTGKFWSRRRLHTLLKGSGIPVVPILTETCFAKEIENTMGPRKEESQQESRTRSRLKSPTTSETFFRKQILDLLESYSRFRSDGGTVEGIILRLEDTCHVIDKYKVVRPDFLRGCGNGHWSTRSIEKQQVDFVFREEYLQSCYSRAISEDKQVVDTD